MRRKHEDFHDGAKDGLTPLEPLDITSVRDFDELLAAMGKTAFGGRSLGEAAEVLTHMVRDPECAIVGTFSGAMSVAKMGLMICEMIDRGWLKVIITTGALIAHGFIETLGRVHYKYPEQVSDRQLFQQGYNRIYDTLEMEANLDYAEDVFRTVLEGLDPGAGLVLRQYLPGVGQVPGGAHRQPRDLALRLFEGGAGVHPGLHRFGIGSGPGGLHGAAGPGGG